MAKLTRDDILKLAQLARLEVSEAEAEELSQELTAVLEYVEQLQAVDVSGLRPTNQVTGLVNVTREDVVSGYGYDPQELLKNVARVKDNLIQVKRMLG